MKSRKNFFDKFDVFFKKNKNAKKEQEEQKEQEQFNRAMHDLVDASVWQHSRQVDIPDDWRLIATFEKVDSSSSSPRR